MDVQKESCPTKLFLLAAWNSAAEVYSQAVAELSRQIGKLSEQDYEKLKQAAEDARERSTQAQAGLEAHIKVHGCDGGEVAA